MNLSLSIMIYLSLGIALTQLRRNQGLSPSDALFCGLFWPIDLLTRIFHEFTR